MAEDDDYNPDLVDQGEDLDADDGVKVSQLPMPAMPASSQPPFTLTHTVALHPYDSQLQYEPSKELVVILIDASQQMLDTVQQVGGPQQLPAITAIRV